MWRMILTYDSDSITIPVNELPMGFESLGYTIRVNEENSLVREFTEQLGFDGTSKTWIKSKIAADGEDIIIECSIDYIENYEWVTLINGILNLEAVEYDEFYVHVNVSDSEFNTKISQRKANQIEYNSGTSISGQVLPGFTDEFIEFELEGAATTTVKGVFLYEAFTKLLQKMTDSDRMILKSSLFGRTDLSSNGFDASYDYPTDGELSLLMVTKGSIISAIEPNGTGAKVAGKTDLILVFEDLFQTINAITPIGMDVIYLGGLPYVVIEKLDYFYKNAQYSFTLEKEDITEFRKTLITKFFNNKISAGFPKISKDTDDGLSDYTGIVNYSSPLNLFNNEYSIIGKYSISPADIELARANPVSGRADDKKELETDEAIFLIDCYRDGATIRSRDNVEGWQVLSGVYGTSPLYTNLRIRPTVNIWKGHGKWVKVGLQKKTGEYLVNQNFEGLSKVVSQETGSSITVTDLANIPIDDLDEEGGQVLLSGYEITFNSPVTSAMLVEIGNYKGYLVKYWDIDSESYAYGWVREVSTNPVDGSETNWRLWESVNITLLQGGNIEFLNTGAGYIEFLNTGAGYIEFLNTI